MDELLKECRISYAKKDFSRLEWLSNQILSMDKNNETALTYKLHVHLNSRQYHLASGLSDEIRSLYPDNIHPYLADAIISMSKKEFKNALSSCAEGLKINDSKKLKKYKIKALMGLERIDEAYEYYLNSKIRDFTFTEALICSAKYSQIEKYGDLSKTQLVDCLLKRCRYLDKYSGDRNEILEVCGEIFKIDRDNEFALEYLIVTLQHLERDKEALEYSERAILLYPENFRFHFYKGEILLWIYKDINGAIESYERGFVMVDDFESRWPDLENIITALFEKSEILIKSGDFNNALKANDKILSYRSNEFRALENIEEIVKKHDVTYQKTPHFKKSLKLRSESQKRVKRIEGCLNAIEVGEFDDEYVNGCSEFKDYSSFDEYVRDIIICLMAAYPYQSEEQARFLAKSRMGEIKSFYEYGEPAAYASIDVGYCCG